jgi:cyclic pyranopterin phosphate synthase
VILKENLDEIDDIIEYASNKGIDVNLIQLMPVFYYERDPVRRVELYRRLNGDVWLIEEGLRKKASRIELRQPHNRTVYVMPSGIEVTVIKGYSNPFACITCTRMRITHDGLIKTCLYRENPVVDLRECLEKEDEVCVQQKLLEALMLREPGFKLPYQLSFTAQGPGLSRRKGGQMGE